MTDPSNLPVAGPLPGLPPAKLPASAITRAEEAAAAGGGTRRYLYAVARYKWLILLVGLLGSTAAYFVTNLLPKTYVAEARMWIETSDRNSSMRGPIQPSELLSEYAWLELIRSWTVLDHVTAQERLYLDYHPRDASALRTFTVDSVYRGGAFTLRISDDARTAELRSQQGIVVERLQRGDPIGRQVGFKWPLPLEEYHPNREISFTVLAFRDASKRLANDLLTSMAGRASFMTIEYSGTDPERVASVVNAIAERFVSVATELKRAKLLELRDLLQSQLQTAELSLEEHEQALEAFGVQTITLPTKEAAPIAAGVEATRNTALTSYFALKVDREMLQRDRTAIQRLLQNDADSLSIDGLSAIHAVQQAPELNQALSLLATKRADLMALARTYTNEHVIAQRAAAEVVDLEVRIVPRLARRLISDLDARMTALDGHVAAQSEELREIPVRVSEEGRLRRMMLIANNTYNDLRQRYENARLAADATVPDVSILDPATVPEQPAGDSRLRLLAMAIGGSFGLAILGAILLDRVDPRLRYPEQITYGMHLGILGAVPHMSKKTSLFGGGDAAPVIEALRRVRFALSNAYGTSGPMVLTVSSPGSGDGKTFVSANLALTFAEIGRRTLLIDADLRRGDAHHLFQVPRKSGFSDFLAGACSFEDTVRRTMNEKVDLIPCGTRRSDAPALLASHRMGPFLARIKAEYDVILIDSPPLGAGIDPLILAALSGHIVLVMRNGKTDRALAESQLQQIYAMPVRLLGAILNGADSGGVYKYYSYLPGYEASSEDAEQQLLPA